MRRYPSSVQMAENGWINEESAKGVDESHIESREPPNWSDIDCPEQPITAETWLQREYREGVDRSVANLADRFVRMDIEDRERAVSCAGLDERAHAVLFRNPPQVGLGFASWKRGIPAENPTKQPPQAEQCANDGIQVREALRTQERSNICDRSARSPARKLDLPHVVERHLGEQFVRPQVEPAVIGGFCQRPRAHFRRGTRGRLRVSRRFRVGPRLAEYSSS